MNVDKRVATVVTVTPFVVRRKGDLVNVPVQRRVVTVPGDLSAGQQVLVDVVEREVTFLGRWDTA